MSTQTPPAVELVRHGLAISRALIHFAFSHVALRRIGVLLSVESELVRDDRLPPKKGFGGVRGCIRHVIEHDSALGLFRGIIPYALITAMRTARDCVVLNYVRSQPLLAPGTAAGGGGHALQVLRMLATPAVLTALCWPVKAVYNVVLGNYMTDVVLTSTVDVGTTAGEAQERSGYRYRNPYHCFQVVLTRMGGFKNILNNGWEAYLASRYVSFAVFELTAVLAQVLAARHGSCTRRDTALRIVEKFVRLLLIYPFGNIMLRMSLLDTEDAIDRVRGCRRYESSLDCVKSVYEREGVRGFYDGLRWHVFVMVVTSAAEVVASMPQMNNATI